MLAALVALQHSANLEQRLGGTAGLALSCRAFHQAFGVRWSERLIKIHSLEFARSIGFADQRLCDVAAWNGDLRLLRWALNHGYLLGQDTFYIAQECGHDHILEWAAKVGLTMPRKPKTNSPRRVFYYKGK